jgi:hypothetical protein
LVVSELVQRVTGNCFLLALAARASVVVKTSRQMDYRERGSRGANVRTLHRYVIGCLAAIAISPEIFNYIHYLSIYSSPLCETRESILTTLAIKPLEQRKSLD